MATIRTFISFRPPENVRDEIAKIQDQLKESHADIKWDLPQQFHATIKFLGDVEERTMPNVLSTIRRAIAGTPPFEITYQIVGSFPDNHHPRIVWIGCEDGRGTLLQLKNNLDKLLLPLGFVVEDRKFHPHITLGRVKSNRNVYHLTPMLENCTFEPRVAVVEDVLVMKSVLKPQGAEYSVLQSIHLSA